MSGCWDRYKNNEVVPALPTPARRRFANLARDSRRAASGRASPFTDPVSPCATAKDDRRHRLGEDVKVERHRPVLHVEEVVPHIVLEVEVAPAAHLPQTGHAGLDQ